MKPKTKENHVGIEIEFLCTKSFHGVQRLVKASSINSFVELTTDGSVEDEEVVERKCSNCKGMGYFHLDGSKCKADRALGIFCDGAIKDCEVCDGVGTIYPEGFELRVLLPESKLKVNLMNVCKFLKDIKAYVNDTCGLHVHLDMRHRKPATCFNNLVLSQDVLYGVVDPKRKTSTYCKPTQHAWLQGRSFPEYVDRYQGVNQNAYKEHKTIELRMHHGTILFRDIYPWINLLISIVNAPAMKKEIDYNVRSFTKAVTPPSNIRRYVSARKKKYERPPSRRAA